MIAAPNIPQKPREEIVHRDWGDTQDIIEVIMSVVNKKELGDQVQDFSQAFKASTPSQQREKLQQLWRWVRNNIPYVADPNGVQVIKHPARTWEDAQQGRGSDCKSMTVFVRFVLYNLGIPHVIRFASYVRSKRIQHVYAVATVGGKDVIVDTVHTKFDEEVPYTFKKDIKPDRMTKIVEIAGLQRPVQLPKRPYFPLSQMTEGELQVATKIRELEMIEAINRSAGRIKEADEQAEVVNELNNVLRSGLHSGGISLTRLPKLRRYWRKLTRLDRPCYLSHVNIAGDFDPSQEQEQFCQNQARYKANMEAQQNSVAPWGGSGPPPFSMFPDGRSYFEVYNGYLDDCLEIKEMENVVNAHLIDAGPNFLYDQMGSGNYNSIISVKHINQNAWTYTASQATGLSEGNVRNIARLGTIEKLTQKGYGDLSTPEAAKNVLYPYMQPGGIGGAAIGIGIAEIIALIAAIASLVSAGVGLVRSFVQASKAQQAFENIPDPGSPNFRIRQSDFLIETDSDGNPTPPSGGGGGGPDLNTSNLFGGLMSDPMNLALVAAAGYLIFQPKSK